MKYLLDTHTLIWAITAPEKLSPNGRNLLEDQAQQIAVSAVSFWEISLKFALGKLTLSNLSPGELPGLCRKMEFELLPIEPDLCATYHQFTSHYHRDPFDRMLLWQAKTGAYTLISKDEKIKLYAADGISVIW